MLGADEEELYQHPAASQTPAKGPLLVMGNVLPSFPTPHTWQSMLPLGSALLL